MDSLDFSKSMTRTLSLFIEVGYQDKLSVLLFIQSWLLVLTAATSQQISRIDKSAKNNLE